MWRSGVILFVFSIFLLNLSEIIGDGPLPDGTHEEEKESWGKNRSPKVPFIMPLTDDLIKEAGYVPESYDVDVRVGRNITIKHGKVHRWTTKRNTNNAEVKYWNKFKIRIFRIRDPEKLEQTNLPVVLLMHGCLGSSSDYVFGGKKDGLGFYLVDNGYDVWLGNLRGNFYAGLNMKNASAFWDFSFHEMGIYDLPAQIEFIRNVTGQEKIFYIGFSMGTTSSYVMLSQLPDYSEKIVRMISMAPVVFMERSMGNWLEKILLVTHSGLDAASRKTGLRSLSYSLGPLKMFRTPKCYKKKWTKLCGFAINIVASKNKTVLDKELREKSYKVIPIGTSFKTIMHYFKLTKYEKFMPYSYSVEKNLEVYKVAEVPSYPLEKVTVPILLIMGLSDGFTPKRVIEKLKKSLPGHEKGLVLEKWVDDVNFMHMDFFVGQNLKKLVFEPVLKYLNDGQT